MSLGAQNVSDGSELKSLINRLCQLNDSYSKIVSDIEDTGHRLQNDRPFRL